MKITRENFLKKGSSFIFTLTLVMSLVVVSSLGSQAANSQSNDACTKLSIPNIFANFERAGNEATKAIDLSLATKWAYEGEGAYIQADLGNSAFLCSIDIAWFRGDTRSYNFVVSVSDDGQTFRDIVSGKSTGTTVMQERYNMPDINARYLRVTVNGNSLNNLAAISDMTINGRVVEECSIPQISGVAAIGNDGNVPQNTLDNNLNTRWSNLGLPSWIQYDLGESQPICSVDVAWYRGDLRVNAFTISGSNDGINFTPIFSGQSSGKTIGLERYDVADTMSRYLRITVTGNTENSWSSISEVRINGGAIMECKSPQISGVAAIGDDGNVPQNTLDSNLNTRWSNLGFPSWIQYDLGESQPICNVDIAWYRGNFRVNAFTISGSNDGINFTPIFSGQSSGKTIGLERYDVADTMSRYLRITVTGNTENSWSSISEVRINGGAIMECKSPQISGVAAIGNDGNVPQNTLDSNLNTRWSNLGFPSWIQYDLGESQPICNVDIAWWRGNFRVNTFTISVSNDGTNFTPIFSGQSSGQTIGLERYDVSDTFGRYMRITVIGNNENSWSSISEVRINGGAETPPPPPQEICGNGIDDDGDGL